MANEVSYKWYVLSTLLLVLFGGVMGGSLRYMAYGGIMPGSIFVLSVLFIFGIFGLIYFLIKKQFKTLLISIPNVVYPLFAAASMIVMAFAGPEGDLMYSFVSGLFMPYYIIVGSILLLKK